MNIIIVGKAHAVPTRIDLDQTRNRLIAAGILGAAALALLGAGFAAAFFFTGSSARDLHEIADLRASDRRRARHSSPASTAIRNATSTRSPRKLGQLQAQATRLNALGDRLTQVGKLDDGEFDFSSDPALGGPEEPVTGTHRAAADQRRHRQPPRRVRSPGSAARRAREPPARSQGRQRAAAERHAGRAGLHRVGFRRALRSDQRPPGRSISASISTRRSARRSPRSPKASSASSASSRATATSSRSTTATAT